MLLCKKGFQLLQSYCRLCHYVSDKCQQLFSGVSLRNCPGRNHFPCSPIPIVTLMQLGASEGPQWLWYLWLAAPFQHIGQETKCQFLVSPMDLLNGGPTALKSLILPPAPRHHLATRYHLAPRHHLAPRRLHAPRHLRKNLT